MEIKKVALTLGIAILFVFFIVFFIEALYEAPKYEDYCENILYHGFPRLPDEDCVPEYNQSLANDCFKNSGEIRYNYDEKGCEINPYCDYCSKEFTDENAKYNKNIFFISAIIGIIAIIAGLYLPRLIDVISSGFMFGGILVLLQGTVRVFGDLGKWIRVIVLGVELVLLVWVGYKRIIPKKEENARTKKRLHSK